MLFSLAVDHERIFEDTNKIWTLWMDTIMEHNLGTRTPIGYRSSFLLSPFFPLEDYF